MFSWAVNQRAGCPVARDLLPIYEASELDTFVYLI